MADLNVAVVGSGPAGLYTAEALVKQAAALDPPCQVQVDVLDRLPTPYGLVRYGVAPDHPSIKSIAEYLRGVLEHPRCASSAGCGSAARSPARTCSAATTRWSTRPARCATGGWASTVRTCPAATRRPTS